MKALPVLKHAVDATGERTQALHAIWLRVAGDRKAPRRVDITLRDTGKLTSWVVLFDVLGSSTDFRIRLTGDGLVRFFDANFAGRRLSTLKERPFFHTTFHALAHCAQHCDPVVVGPMVSNFENKEHWSSEFIFLPLSDDGETVTGVIGTMDLWQAGAQTDPAGGDATF